jgi:prepilin-type N-terminal cleavage/methylation domain-containing protein
MRRLRASWHRADLRSEDGYSLTELVVTLAVGSVLLMAIFLVLDTLVVQSARVQDRVDNVQRGRQAMESITQSLRSQVCLGAGIPAISQADDNSVTYYGDLGDENFTPNKYRLAYDPATNGGTITEYLYPGSGTPPNVTFPGSPSRQRTLITHATRYTDPSTGQVVPMFRYYAFTSQPVTPNQLQTTPLDGNPSSTAANAAAKTVKVGISFTANPTRQTNRTKSLFQNYVYVRTSDPSDPDHSPQCN